MTFFHQFSGEVAPILRLLNDYESHQSCGPKRQFKPVRSFTPKFDVRELDNGYHLDGELSGVDQNNIEIEFSDPNTLVIKGHVDRNYNVTPNQAEETTDDATSVKSHQPTVEDEDEDASSATTPATPSTNSEGASTKKTSNPGYKYWASERSVGKFHRTFTFPTRVDQDAVKASLRNGILSVVVPKEPAPKLKKIRIE